MTELTTSVTIKVFTNSTVTPELDHAIREGLVECYPLDSEHFASQRSWHSTPEWIVCALTSDGMVAGHIAVVERMITAGTDACSIKVAGLQCVFVRPPWRKTGLTDRMMSAVLKEARNRNLDAGLLFCREVLADKVYGRMGWKKVNAEVIMQDELGRSVSRPSHDIAMSLPLVVERFPVGDIDLNGPDW